MQPDVSVSRFIAASPATVYAAITDITRMGEWSPETVGTEWVAGHDSPVVGARYIGHNKNGDKEWSIETEIVELVESERFYFDCISPSSGSVFAHWGYDIEAADGGCQVTEHFQDLRPVESRSRGAALSGVEDRETHNRAGMEVTLERLGAAVS